MGLSSSLPCHHDFDTDPPDSCAESGGSLLHEVLLRSLSVHVILMFVAGSEPGYAEGSDGLIHSYYEAMLLALEVGLLSSWRLVCKLTAGKHHGCELHVLLCYLQYWSRYLGCLARRYAEVEGACRTARCSYYRGKATPSTCRTSQIARCSTAVMPSVALPRHAAFSF